jgi:glycosyltransferase involved in cell wall biosynthesis
MSLSVIIPTYNNTEFLVELFDSIEKNNSTFDFEVLVGIDNCIKTLEFVIKNKFPTKVRFFFFHQNYGPYVIKNTLSKLSKYDKLFFFDSDDIMRENAIQEISNKLDHFQLVKPKYINFQETSEGRIFNFEKLAYGEGVFGILKDKFMSLNGFEGWRVAADSDFMGRLYKTNVRLNHTQDILFDRRLHPKSLTVNPETNYSSQIRTRYYLISKKKTHEDIVLEELKTGEYEEVFYDKDLEIPNSDDVNTDEVLQDLIRKEERSKKLLGLFEKLPKKMADNTKPKIIDYQQVNTLNNRQTLTNMTNALKKAKLKNIQRSSRR